MVPARGQVYWATVNDMRKPYLVVSNNARNQKLGTCLAVRITTSSKPDLDSIVELSEADRPIAGRVLCDDIAEMWPDEDGFVLMGALTPATLMRVNDGLKVALALR